MHQSYRFEFVPRYFVDLAELASQSSDSQVGTQPSLGLLNRDYEYEVESSQPEAKGQRLPQWKRFADFVKHLNRNSKDDECYKVLFVLRHGLGVHNVARNKYGGDAWNNHWSYLDGDGKDAWADAELVEKGIDQAKELGDFWTKTAQNDGTPLPETFYTSPLRRCMHTTRLAYTPVTEAYERKFQPIIKELLRERLTNHTCDRRSARSWIRENYPDYGIEENFEEKDTLWRADKSETEDEHVARKQRLLEDIFTNDDSEFISLSTHSYALSAILRCIGAPKFRVREGTMVALFVKATRISE